jgi:hypothetical protein
MESGNTYLSPGGRAWAEQQLVDAGYGDFGGDVVKSVLDVVDAMAEAFPEETSSSVGLVAKLITGTPLGEEDWSEQKKAEGYVWRPVVARELRPGQVVRVREDAYTEMQSMYAHNGRQGKVLTIRNGIVVLYDNVGSNVTQMGVTHDPSKLERRVRIMFAQGNDN